MSVRRMSFNETPDWLDRLGFKVALDVDFDHVERRVIVRRGSLAFGFKSGDAPAGGFVVNDDMSFPLPSDGGDAVFYITMARDGSLLMDRGDFGRVRGLGAGVAGIPWYTFDFRALIGKCFFRDGFFQGAVVCDDAFWCEFEGGF